MDARANQYHQGNPRNELPNYSFAQSQNDTFSSYIDGVAEPQFESSWPNQEFQSSPQSGVNFDQRNLPWQPNPYQRAQSNYLSVPQYGLNQRFAGESGQDFQYAAYQEYAKSQFPQTSYSGAPEFDTPPSNHLTGLQFAHSPAFEQPSQTISPAAIESYPETKIKTSAPQPTLERAVVSQADSSQGKAAGQAPIPSLSIQEWRQLATRNVKSIDRPGLHIKPTNQYESATQSKRFDGFVFVGSDSIAVNTVKVNVPRYKKKRSRNEAIRLLESERAVGVLHSDREATYKRLKIAARKQAGPLQNSQHAHGRDQSASDSSGFDSDVSSDKESSSDPEKEPEEPSPLPPTRPLDPNKAVEYDLLKVVWAKRSAVLAGPYIRSALTETWEIFKGLRDKWKQKTVSLQHAIEKKDQATERAFERRVAEQRRLLESCIKLTLQHGHPSIVEKLSENPVLLVVFYQFLVDRFKDGEYTGSFVNSILQVLAKGDNMDPGLLEKTKIDKLLQRLQKRGDEQGKALVQSILDRAKRAELKPASASQANESKKKDLDSAKQPNIDDTKTNASLALKKPTDNAARAAGPTGNLTSKTSADSNAVPKKSEGTDTKSRVVNVPSKPSAFFSGLKSASKRQGTSSKSEDTSSSPEKKADAAVPAPKPSFSFAATMAGLTKQKEEPTSKVEETRKPETADERKKRLRKEQRRKLRVSFKDDEDLVSIKIFVHDPDEELGHNDSQVRDAGDSKGEGQMLKMHKELELDDEEDYEPPEDILPQLSSWITPIPTDFSAVDDAEAARNYASRGGKVEIISVERDALQERENATLVAVYRSRDDIPPSPREPVDSSTDEKSAEQDFGDPGSMIKERQQEFLTRKTLKPAPNVQATPDISAILQIFNKAKQQPQAQPHQQTPAQPTQAPETANALASILASFSNPNNAQTSLPQQPAAPFNFPAPPGSTQQPFQAPAYPPQPSYGTPASPANPMGNLQAILAQIGNQNQAPPQANATSANASSSYGHMNEDRKRQLESEDDDAARKKARGGKPFLGIPHLPCKFWQEGKCRKGDDCTFLHDAN